MTLDHVAKVGDLIFPVKRVASDGSLILALPNGGELRLIPGGAIIGTDKKNGQIKLYRKRPVKHGLKSSAFFRTTDLQQVLKRR